MTFSSYYVTPEQYAKAAEMGIKRETVNHRVRSLAWSVERDISTPTGARYRNPWKSYAVENGIPGRRYEERVRRGWSKQLACTIPVEPRNTHDREMADMAQRNGISYDAYAHRVKKLKWTPEEAATVPILKPGKYFKGWKGGQQWRAANRIIFTPGLSFFISTGIRRNGLARLEVSNEESIQRKCHVAQQSAQD